MRAVALLLMLGGCDAVFGLEERLPPDAPPPIDTVDAAPPIDAALSGHDEDGDTVDDAIDNCPGRANLDQIDGDSDGVGQACDPNPGHAIDRLRYFATFSTFSGWTQRTGSWAIFNETLRVDFANGNLLAVLDLGPFTEPTVMATIDVVAGSSFYGAGVYLVTDLGGQLDLPPGLMCWTPLPAGGMQMYDYRTANHTVRSGSLPTAPDPLDITLSGGSTTAGVGPLCSGRRPDDSSVTVPPASDPTPIATAHVGLYVFTAAARFGSVTVIDRAP